MHASEIIQHPRKVSGMELNHIIECIIYVLCMNSYPDLVSLLARILSFFMSVSTFVRVRCFSLNSEFSHMKRLHSSPVFIYPLNVQILNKQKWKEKKEACHFSF